MSVELESMSGELDLWQAVDKTDPKHVKPITGKSYRGNSPRPQWLVYQATKTFGPCGIGWGYEILSERVEATEAGSLHVARVSVWYHWQGRRGQVEHIGATPFSGWRKEDRKFVKSDNNLFLDEDAPKKSVTDALIKCLSMLGFAGDIFLGRWDDQKYVASLAGEFDETPAILQPSAERYIADATAFLNYCNEPKIIRQKWTEDGQIRQAILTAEERQSLLKLVTERLTILEKRAS